MVLLELAAAPPQWATVQLGLLKQTMAQQGHWQAEHSTASSVKVGDSTAQVVEVQEQSMTPPYR
jgi:hypothetical protein